METNTLPRRSYVFTVAGERQTGVVYVTLTGADDAANLARATRIAARRSGDPAPVFVRAEPPRR